MIVQSAPGGHLPQANRYAPSKVLHGVGDAARLLRRADKQGLSLQEQWSFDPAVGTSRARPVRLGGHLPEANRNAPSKALHGIGNTPRLLRRADKQGLSLQEQCSPDPAVGAIIDRPVRPRRTFAGGKSERTIEGPALHQ